MPGQSRQIPLDALPAGATVDAVAAVLDDGTAIGDETVADGRSSPSARRSATR